MKRTMILLMALISFANLSTAQRACGTDGHLHDMLQQDPGLQDRMDAIETFTQNYLANNPAGDRTVVTIPVVFHIVWDVAVPAQNISDAQIASQMTVLNNDFRKLNADWPNTPAAFLGLVADCEVNFCMAQRDPSGAATTGIIRKSSTVANWGTNDAVKFNAQMGSDAWPAASYLNIWVCSIGGGILGYAQFPGGPANTDGVVNDYRYLGTIGTATPPFNKGRTATHEVGHWLNLYHIWGDDGTGCSGSDLVADTPNQGDENYGCPTFPQVSCSNGPNGDMFMNYMDYTDDACMFMFSTGQKDRAQAVLAAGGARASLATSLGCTPPTGGSCGAATGLSAGSITQTAATLSWAAVAGATNYNLQWKLASASTWTTVSAIATTSHVLSGLAASTSYNYRVQANCNGTLGSYSAAASFTTTTAGGGGCSENNEANNTRQTAKPVTPGTAKLSQISTAIDKDYWKFGNSSATRNIKINLSTLPADYDLKAYRSSTLIGTSQNTGTTDEQLIFNNATVSSNYTAYVYGYNGAFSNTQCYTLLVSLSSTAWRTDGTTNGDVEEMFVEFDVESAEFGLFPNPATDQVTIDIPMEKDGSAHVSILDMTGRRVATQERGIEKGDSQFTFQLGDMIDGLYFVQVRQGEVMSTRKLVVQH